VVFYSMTKKWGFFPRYERKTRGPHFSHWAPDDGRENARNMLSCKQTSGRVGTGLSVLWMAYATHSTLKPGATHPRYRHIVLKLWQIPDAVDTVVCAPDDGWKYNPKHVEQLRDINKLCNVESCWI
jgi:hypothetical protein